MDIENIEAAVCRDSGGTGGLGLLLLLLPHLQHPLTSAGRLLAAPQGRQKIHNHINVHHRNITEQLALPNSSSI